MFLTLWEISGQRGSPELYKPNKMKRFHPSEEVKGVLKSGDQG